MAFLQNKWSPLLLSALCLLVISTSCLGKTEGLSASMERELHSWLDSSRRPPGNGIEILAESGRSLIFVQDDILRRDSLLLMEALTPLFFDLGIRRMAVYFLDYRDQKIVDSYLKGETEEDTHALALQPTMGLAYREYHDYLNYVKSFNDSGKNQQDTITLFGLSDEGGLSSERMEQFFKDGEEQAPFFAWILSADLPLITERMKAGRLPDSAILTHYGPEKDALRWNGLVEKVQKNRSVRDASYALFPDEQPFSSWPYPMDFEADLIIVAGFDYQGVLPVSSFATKENISALATAFPDFRMYRSGMLAAFRLNRLIRITARRYARMLSKL